MHAFTPERRLAPPLAAVAVVPALRAAASRSPADLVAALQSNDAATRGSAWQGAAAYGAAAVTPLGGIVSDDFEIMRSARRALWVITRHAGRPGAEQEAAAVSKRLCELLASGPTLLRREVLWMLSEIGGDDAIPAIAALLADPVLRGDALCSLMRLPGRKATAALNTAFKTASDDFKYAVADALRKRGESLKSFPSQKLLPVRPTSVSQPAAQ